MNIKPGSVFLETSSDDTGRNFVNRYMVTFVTGNTVTVAREGSNEILVRVATFFRPFGTYTIETERGLYGVLQQYFNRWEIEALTTSQN